MARATPLEMLKEQYGFLKRSIEAVMQGNLDEALRIATTIRVLVHETRNSIPLLKQVDPNYLQLTILGVPPPVPPKPGDYPPSYIGVLVRVKSQTGLQPIVDFDGYPRIQLNTLEDWWNQVILIFSDAGQKIAFTRQQIILTLANKEGGAHVDTTLPSAYEEYVIDSPLKFIVNKTPADTAHLARYAAVQAAAQICECLERNFPSVTA